MPLVRAWLRKDLDATVTWKLILGRERVLIDADLADRFLGWNLSVREPIDFYLCPVFSFSWSGHRLQRSGKRLRIVGQCFEIASAQNYRARIVLGIGTDIPVVDCHLLFFQSHR